MLSSFKLSPGVMQAAVNTLCQVCSPSLPFLATCSKHLSLSIFTGFCGDEREFCDMVTWQINIEIMSADVWGTDHTRWLPGETGHTEVCTLIIGDCCDEW